jgi:general secretion pathway protein G
MIHRRKMDRKIPNRHKFIHRDKLRGLTLVEVLAVLVIVAIVGGLVGPAIFNQISKGKSNAARAQISNLEKSLDTFYLDCGFYPATEPGLNALVTPPDVGRQCAGYDSRGYVKDRKLPKDPWGLDFFYVSPGENRPDSFDLFSAGPDGQPYTEDDVNNWR